MKILLSLNGCSGGFKNGNHKVLVAIRGFDNIFASEQ